MNQNKLREQLKIIKNYTEIESKDIAEWLEIKNVRSISNFLHGDFNLSEEKRGKRTSWFCDIRMKLWREFTQSFNTYI